jgi:flagellar hook-length control protein FliK
VQIGESIVAHAEVVRREGRTDIYMRLDPPELGTVQVHLSASAHAVSARLVIHGEEARQIVESQLHSLRQTLAQAGVSLDKLDVRRDGQGSPEAWRRPSSGAATGSRSSSRSRIQPAEEMEAALTVPGRIDVVV